MMEEKGANSEADALGRFENRQNEFGETVAHFPSEEGTAIALPGGGVLKKPEQIGRYAVRGIIGRGGFGAVFLGYDAQLGREVAIKVARPMSSSDHEQLFLKEARQLAQLSHPHIVTVHDVGIDSGMCYIVSEYLGGPDLNHWLKGRTLEWRDAVGIVVHLADALSSAHAQGIIHRDVKPANVIMSPRGDSVVPVLVDFGLAISLSSAMTAPEERGNIAGTPNYMSPEQARGEGHRIDGRTDIYSLGVILYRLLSGKLPFAAPSMSDLLQAIIADEPRPPRQFVRGLPRELERICLQAMAKQLADRYTTAGDFADELRALLRAREDHLAPSPSPSSTEETRKSRATTRILIADDHELTRFKLQTDLQKWGHEVTAAEDGEQAWELFQKGQFSIVITDWMMPRLDGLELVRMIRGANREDYVYVIMLTAKAEKHDIVVGMGAGADDFLTKPFHRDELQVRVRAGIRITSLNRELSESNRRLQQAREAAAQIQRLLMPSAKPRIKGFEFAWDHAACEKLGGDMLNVVPLDDEHVGVFVLDVTGDGAPAALMATTLSRLLSSASDPASILVTRDEDGLNPCPREPREVARELNRRFGAQQGRQYFTIAYGVLDLSSREFAFTSAGHPPLILVRAEDSPTMLDVEGFPIGMAPEDDEFGQESLVLQGGDRLLLYSDGLTDTMNNDGEVFGAARLLEAVQGRADESLDGLIRAVMDEARTWRGPAELNDDISVVALEISRAR